MIAAIATPDTEIDPLEFKARGYLLRGIIKIGNDEKPVKLISMQNPVTSLKHKFKNEDGQVLEQRIISHRQLTGCVGETLYLKSINNEYKLDIKQ